MESSHNRMVKILIEQGYKKLKQPYEKINFTKDVEEQPYEKINFTKDEEEANDLLNNLKEFPHAYVLGCIMDRQIESGRAWIIPYRIQQELGDFSISKLLQLNLNQIEYIFKKENLHWLYSDMTKNFYQAIQQINEVYHGDASLIWKDTPRSGMVVRRFLKFKGVGFKIA